MNPEHEPDDAARTESASEHLERRIGLSLDGRLSPAQESALAAELERSPAARRVRAELLAVRETLRSEPVPRAPEHLLRDVRARVSAVRTELAASEALVRLARPYVAAAAVLLIVGLSFLVTRGSPGAPGNGGLQAAPTRTIEDDLRGHGETDPGLVRFLARHFFGHER